MTTVKAYLYRQLVDFRGTRVVRSAMLRQLVSEGFELKVRECEEPNVRNLTSPNMRYRMTLHNLVKGQETYQLSPRSTAFVLHLLGNV